MCNLNPLHPPTDLGEAARLMTAHIYCPVFVLRPFVGLYN